MNLIEWINGRTKLNKTTFDTFQNNIKDAIDENSDDIATNASHIGIMSNLDTTVKSSLVGAINEVVQSSGAVVDTAMSATSTNAVQNKVITAAIEAAILASHPVGSYYWSSESTSPATLFGGTWTRVTDKFVLAAGSTYTAGDTGGAATVTLTTSQIPSHTHTFTGNALAGHSHRVLLHGCGVEATGYGLTASNFFKDNVKTGTSAANGDLSSSVSAGTPSGTNSNTGGGEAHNNMPPYEVAYCWKRTA